MIEVELPDGTIAEIDTDDPNVAAEAGRRFLQSQQRAQQPAAPPQAPIAGASRDDVARGLAPPSMLDPRAGGPQPRVTIDTPPGPERGTSLSRGVQAVGRAVGNVVGMPVDLGAAALNAGAAGIELANRAVPFTPNITLPRVTDPVMGGEWIRRHAGNLAESAGFPVADQNALTPGERAAMRGTEAVTETLLGGQAMRGLGALRRAGQPAGTPMGPISRNYAEQPGRAVASDVGAGAGVGVARTGMDEYGPDPNTTLGSLGRMAAEFMGGLGGATAVRMVEAPTTIAQVVRNFLSGDPHIGADPATGLVPRRGVGDEARRRMQGAAVDPEQAATNIEQGTQFYRERGMPTPTSGLLSNDEGLIGLERGMRGNDPTMIQRDRQVAQAAADQLGSVAPADVPVEPNARAAVRQQASDRIARQADAERRFSEGQVTGAQQRVESAGQAEQDLAGQVAQRAETRPAAGRRFDEAIVDETMQPMQAQQRALYDAIPNTVQPADDLMRLTQNIRDSIPPGVPESAIGPLDQWLTRIERDYGPRTLPDGSVLPAEAGIQDVNNMRPFLSDAITSARRNGNFALADSLERLRRHINDRTAALAASGGPGGAEAAAAVRYSSDEIAPRFGAASPEMADLRARVNRDPRNRSEAPRENTAPTFLGPQTNQGTGARLADQVTRALRGAPSEAAGRQAARDYVMADMASVVGSDGRINLRRLDEWTRNRAGMLRAFPEIEVEATTMRRDVVNRRAASTQMQRELEATRAQHRQNEADSARSAAALFLDADPLVAVERVFNNPNPTRRMQEIVQRLQRDPEALRGWRTAVADYLERANTNSNVAATSEGSRNVSGARLENLFTDHRRALEALYGAGSREMQALENAHRAVTDMMRLGVRGVQGSETAPLLERILNAAAVPIRAPSALGGFGAVTGGMLMRNLRTALGSIPMLNNEQAVQRVLRRAQLDPDLAAHLLRSDVSERSAPAWNRRLVQMLAIQDATQEQR